MRKFNSKKLKEILEERNISQVSLAEKLEISPATISAWLCNKTNPEPMNLENLINILKIEIEDITDEVNEYSVSLGDFNDGSNCIVHATNSNITIFPQKDNVHEYKWIKQDKINNCIVSVTLDTSITKHIIDISLTKNIEPYELINDLLKEAITKRISENNN